MAIIPSTAKVLNQYENVNTTYGGSKAMKAQSKWYTMQDVEDTINANKPYKVFTALLTQSGGDDPAVLSNSDLTIGVTYEIKTLSSGSYDFTNVGAPNNDIGTYFVATGTTPNDWGSASLNYNPGAPVATILENTIGNIWFQYIDVGRYGIYSVDLFDDLKTFINGARLSNDNYATFNQFIQPGSGTPTSRGYFFRLDQGIETLIELNTIKDTDDFKNDIIDYPICIEIRVYN